MAFEVICELTSLNKTIYSQMVYAINSVFYCNCYIIVLVYKTLYFMLVTECVTLHALPPVVINAVTMATVTALFPAFNKI